MRMVEIRDLSCPLRMRRVQGSKEFLRQDMKLSNFFFAIVICAIT
jgi:hypothetical protein